MQCDYNMNKLDEKIISMREIITNAKNPILFFDSDSDGTMSYFQLKTINPNLKGYPFRKVKEEQVELSNRVSKDNDVVLFFDTPHIEEEVFKNISDKRILWVDHHKGNSPEFISKYNILHLNPLDFASNDSRPSCYWAYKIANLKKNLPFVCVGSVADFYLLDVLADLDIQNSKEFSMLFNISLQKKEELLDLVRSTNFYEQLDKRADIIRQLSFETNAGVLKMFFDYIYKLENARVDSVVKSLSTLSLGEILSEISAEKNYPYDDFAKFRLELKSHIKKAIKLNQDKKIAIYSHGGETSFNRQITEECLFKLPTVEVMFCSFEKKDSEMIPCSIRSKSLSIEPLVKKSLKTVQGFGGGHELACGAAISSKDFNRFRGNFTKYVEEKLNLHH